MIEVYLFLAAFTALILVMSVLIPVRFTARIRTELAKIPAERLAELYPGVDVGQAHERFIARYRAANTVVAVLGLLLLGWYFSHMQHPKWDESTVSALGTAYVVLQYCPLLLIAWFTTRFNKVHRRSLPEPKRKAVLQRRGLFDFVSPLTVFLAILSFLQYVVFVFYIARHPFPDFGGPFANIAVITPMYVLSAFGVHRALYGRKKGPLETDANRMYTIKFLANFYVYMCILVPPLLSFNLARKLLGLETWGPFAGTVYFLLFALFFLRSSSAPPRQREADGLGSNPVG